MPRRHGMHALFASPIVSVGDFVCHHDNRDFGADEETLADSIVFVRAGIFERRLEGRTEQADPTRIVFFRAGESVRVRHPLPCGDRCTSVRIAPHLLGEIVAQRAPQHASGRLLELGHSIAPCPPAVFAAHWRLVHSARRGAEVEPVEIEERALELARAALDPVLGPRARTAIVRAATRRTHGEIVAELQRLLAASWRKKVALHELANALSWSPYHLARLFRAATGVSIHRYATGLRLRHALERMQETREELAQIALDCGFASQSHFNDAFRREFGCAPSELRRQRSRCA